jgi:four helix bundle protein
MLQSYRDLKVWQKGMLLTERVYRLCRNLPAEERYGLSQQLKRAAVSIPANIAEGYGRRTLGDYLRFVSIANGSLKEVETLLLLAARLGLVPVSEISEVLSATDELGRMLTVLIRRLSIRLTNQRRHHALHPTPYTLLPSP